MHAYEIVLSTLAIFLFPFTLVITIFSKRKGWYTLFFYLIIYGSIMLFMIVYLMYEPSIAWKFISSMTISNYIELGTAVILFPYAYFLIIHKNVTQSLKVRIKTSVGIVYTIILLSLCVIMFILHLYMSCITTILILLLLARATLLYNTRSGTAFTNSPMDMDSPSEEEQG